ncbi:DUF2892 domain-containing protein [Pelagivirga sediminicola]|uniref:DUF2892 domain-containing protein n=1 Tax=Pelagivirga sediminicola TaxID=2170575 RepID=A0A2T7G4T4_9RHOB|nr:DUF2892 domain-containing protein [Pelagivirga sediminicola]PVA09443.1 DUF2892 domain-containing protein [Pelagivirga sediminicola]
MTPNIGSTDRIFRIFFGLVLIALPFIGNIAFFEPEWVTVASVVIGIVLLATAAMRFCGLYRILGIRTCRM